MDPLAYDFCVKETARKGLPTSMCEQLSRVYSNGREQPGRFECYDRWQPVDRSFATSVAAREMARMYGFNPPNASKLRQDASEIVELLYRDEGGVYSTKPCGERWNWPALACFMNWYAWLNPQARQQVREDIAAGNWRTWAYWAIRMQTVCPAEVSNDPTYSGGHYARSATLAPAVPVEPAWDRKGLSATAPIGPTPKPWPIVDHATGSLPSIPGLPKPCQPFPDCVLGAVPESAIGPFVQAANQIARNTPLVSPTRTTAGLGAYESQPRMPAADTTPDAEPSDQRGWKAWHYAAGAGAVALASVALYALLRRPRPAVAAFEVGEVPEVWERGKNKLPELLRTWFGPDVGLPGVPIAYVTFRRAGNNVWYAVPGDRNKWPNPCIRRLNTFYAQVRVNHASGKPILFPLPNRAKCPEMPSKDTKVIVDGEPWVFGFRKVAVNVASPA